MSFMLISRDFWPKAASVGDGLMELTKFLSIHGKTFVTTMSDTKLKTKVTNKNIRFLVIKPLTDSGSNVLLRLIEIIYFALWAIFALIYQRPNKVYVATNPPFFIPLLVAIYCLLFRKKFIYHVQDIHPEATILVFKIPLFLISILKIIDTWVLNRANSVITISKDMKNTLVSRGCRSNITLLENPANKPNNPKSNKIKGIVFSGNAGRLQNMHIVISAIDKYLSENGTLPFMFVGGGVYSPQLSKLAAKHESFSYVGKVNGQEALKITNDYEWGLLPIKGEVLNYAFPSKLKSYLAAGCKIICCTNLNSSLVKNIDENDFGFSCSENVDALVSAFNSIELCDGARKNFKDCFISPKEFGKIISEICL